MTLPRKWRCGIGSLGRWLGAGRRRTRARAPRQVSGVQLERLEPRVMLSGSAAPSLLLAINSDRPAIVVTRPVRGTASVKDQAGDLYVAVESRATKISAQDAPRTPTGKGGADKESTDIVVTKTDPSGKVVWAEAIQDQGHDRLAGIAVDADENLYVIDSPHEIDAAGGSGDGVAGNAVAAALVVVEFDPLGNTQVLTATLDQSVGQATTVVLTIQDQATAPPDDGGSITQITSTDAVADLAPLPPQAFVGGLIESDGAALGIAECFSETDVSPNVGGASVVMVSDLISASSGAATPGTPLEVWPGAADPVPSPHAPRADQPGDRWSTQGQLPARSLPANADLVLSRAFNDRRSGDLSGNALNSPSGLSATQARAPRGNSESGGDLLLRPEQGAAGVVGSGFNRVNESVDAMGPGGEYVPGGPGGEVGASSGISFSGVEPSVSGRVALAAHFGQQGPAASLAATEAAVGLRPQIALVAPLLPLLWVFPALSEVPGVLGFPGAGVDGQESGVNVPRFPQPQGSAASDVKDPQPPLDLRATHASGGGSPPGGLNPVVLVYQLEALGVIGVLLRRSK